MDAGLLDPLPVYRYRFELVLARRLAIPAHQRAILWRGAFGTVFRPLVCHDLDLVCVACPLLRSCPFPRTFAPSVPVERRAIARLRDPPRPFVFVDPRPEADALQAGEAVSLGLTLVGSAVVDLPYFVVALRKLGDEGMGRRRVRFRVETVRAIGADGAASGTVYQQGHDLVRPLRHAVRARDLRRPGDEAARRLRVRFMTPTDVRGDAPSSSEPLAPSFGALVRRARDRVSALATFFGDAPLAYDAREVGRSADGPVLLDGEIARTRKARRSTRTGERHDVGGIVGSALYEGDGIAAAMPWLRLAEVVGVGKHATFGNGRIGVDVLG